MKIKPDDYNDNFIFIFIIFIFINNSYFILN
jgi:hypothetical protein